MYPQNQRIKRRGAERSAHHFIIIICCPRQRRGLPLSFPTALSHRYHHHPITAIFPFSYHHFPLSAPLFTAIFFTIITSSCHHYHITITPSSSFTITLFFNPRHFLGALFHHFTTILSSYRHHHATITPLSPPLFYYRTALSSRYSFYNHHAIVVIVVCHDDLVQIVSGSGSKVVLR